MSADFSDQPGWPAAPSRRYLSDEPTGWRRMTVRERQSAGAAHCTYVRERRRARRERKRYVP